MNVKYEENLSVDWSDEELARIREIKDAAAETARPQFPVRQALKPDPMARLVRDVMEGRA